MDCPLSLVMLVAAFAACWLIMQADEGEEIENAEDYEDYDA